MRPLTAVLVFAFHILAWAPVLTLAATNTVSSQLEIQTTQQPLGISGVTDSPNTKNIRSSIGLTTDQLKHNLLLSGRMIMDRPDYTTTPLRDIGNNLVTLPNAPSSEFQTEVSLSWSKGQHGASATYFGHTSTSPYEIHGGEVSYEEGFFNKSTLLGVATSYYEQARPSDYFVDRDSKVKQRPLSIYGHEMNVSVEQILTERWKSRIKVSTAKKNGERPRNFGVELRNGYALSSKIFAALSLGDYQENTNEALLNERGYFSAFTSQLELTAEILYEFWLSASYGVSVERESDPRIFTTTQVGTDQYGVAAKWSIKRMSFFLQASATRSNSLTSSSRFSGGLTWDL